MGQTLLRATFPVMFSTTVTAASPFFTINSMWHIAGSERQVDIFLLVSVFVKWTVATRPLATEL